MKLYGTPTSPFVRRVRVVAAEVGAPVELVDVRTPEAQAELRRLTPIWKVPVAEIVGEVIFDSHVIIDHLLARYGYGALRPLASNASWRERNIITVIDGATDAAINTLYLARDGIQAEQTAYLTKQRDRVQSALAWLESQLRGPWLSPEPRLGLAEIALQTTLEWLLFRQLAELPPGLERFREGHAEHASFAATRPEE